MATIEEASSSPIEDSFQESLGETTISSRSSGGKATPEEPLSVRLDVELPELFLENVTAKIWVVATRLLKEQVGS